MDDVSWLYGACDANRCELKVTRHGHHRTEGAVESNDQDCYVLYDCKSTRLQLSWSVKRASEQLQCLCLFYPPSTLTLGGENPLPLTFHPLSIPFHPP